MGAYYPKLLFVKTTDLYAAYLLSEYAEIKASSA